MFSTPTAVSRDIARPPHHEAYSDNSIFNKSKNACRSKQNTQKVKWAMQVSLNCLYKDSEKRAGWQIFIP